MESPSTPCAPELAQLRAALAALAINSAPGRGLAQRHEERATLEAFLARRLAACRPTSTTTDPLPGSLYVCGPVGTGKTALVRDVVTRFCAPPGTTAQTPPPAARTG